MNIAPTDSIADQLAEGGTCLLDLVAAVDYLRRGIRPNITVWDALGESLRWLLAETDPSPNAPDAIAAAIVDAMAADVGAPISIQTAIRRWVLTMADRYNDGHHWPHPEARRGFPPPRWPDLTRAASEASDHHYQCRRDRAPDGVSRGDLERVDPVSNGVLAESNGLGVVIGERLEQR
jgi:hypothetical protein